MSGSRRWERVVGRCTLLAVVLLAGCTQTRQLDRGDWGALAGSESITVMTTSGVRHEIGSFRFVTTGLVGLGEWTGLNIPLDSISMVEVREVDVAATALTVLAVATGIGVLIAFGQSPERPMREPSCPFVYSFDGEEYHFDSETFAGAIAPGLDRTDFDNLQYLRPVEGSYRLRLTNERPETQYTDELGLMIVDHPPGARVAPDRMGGVHVLTDPMPPESAIDVYGSDALAELREADGRSWTGEPPEAADLDDPEDMREGLVLTFRRPPEAEEARLVVTARNTALAPFALRKFLELQGEDLFGWYLRVQQDATLRERIRGWVAREGMLHVSIWQDGQWVFRDALPDVGPAIDKDQAVRLDLNGLTGDTVVIKLESARGLWEIDWVALDAGTPAPIRITELTPRSAFDSTGRDLTSLLSTTDQQYYATVEGAVAEIEFDVPEDPAGDWERSVILKSRGFYYLYVPHTGPSQAAVADRILDEPLFGNRYVLGKLREAMQ